MKEQTGPGSKCGMTAKSERDDAEPPHHAQNGSRGDEPDFAHPLPAGGRGKRKPPRWVIPFLRALERTGEVRTAARDAGVDHSTAYARRKAHADFAADWTK